MRLEIIVPGRPLPQPKEQQSMSDVQRMSKVFEALGLGESDQFLFTTIPGDPWSKGRPRFARTGHTYTDPRDRDAQERTARYLRSLVSNPMTGNVALGCVFYRSNRQRIDTDNLIKHVCDAANGILWVDDSQCTAVMGIIEHDSDNPRTLVVVGQHISTMARGTDYVGSCAACGKTFQLGKFATRKTCSSECAIRVRGYKPLGTALTCPQCKQKFVPTTAYRKMCSPACRVASITARRKGKAKPRSQCARCGVTLTHCRGGECRPCWRIGRAEALSK